MDVALAAPRDFLPPGINVELLGSIGQTNTSKLAEYSADGLDWATASRCIKAVRSQSFADGAFDGAYMLRVGMNIEDKTTLCAEVSRVLRSGAMFGIYDVMRTGDGELTYPVHWAETDAASAVREPEHYKEALRAAGFVIVRERNRRDFAIAFFEQLRATAAASGGPPPLGLHILMGKTTPIKVKNMIENVSTGRVSPVELIARKA